VHRRCDRRHDAVVDAPERFGTFGAVASTNWLATATAMSVLERGGNAFDAAIAGGFVLTVAEPDQNGLGGEVPIIVRTAGGDVRVICGQGPAPAAATPERFAELGLDLIPGSGVLAACVPGAFDAWMLLAREYGTWAPRELLANAIGYARHGVPVSAGLAKRVAAVAGVFRTHWPTSADLYLADGGPYAGGLLRNPALAMLLEGIVSESEAASGNRVKKIDAARAAWRTGFVVAAAFRWLRGRRVRDLEGREDVALLAPEDWTRHEATTEDPVSSRFGDSTVFKAGPWSQGPVLLQTLGLMTETGLASTSPETGASVHALIEAQKLAFADREAWYGDPLFADVPLEDLLSTGYARERRALIGERAATELRPGSPGGRPPRLPSWITKSTDPAVARAAARAARALPAGGDTAHIDVVDRDRNVVSAMPSGGWLQSSPVIPELGFPLGTRAQMFWLEPGLPNSLAPGKRPRTTLTPTVVIGDDGTVIGCGSPGGDGQDQWTAQLLVRLLAQRSPLHYAIDAPTFNSMDMPLSFWPRGRRPGVVQLESDWAEDIVIDLRRRGHAVELVPAHSQGWPCAVRADGRGLLTAAASARGRNCAAAIR
jgi:gamma-glutamyltranspeptidase / glutathione hydrolase